MKKTILSLLLLLSLLLVSCQQAVPEPEPEQNPSPSTPIQTGMPLFVPGNFTPPKPPDIELVGPSNADNYYFYSFDSYDELYSALKDSNDRKNQTMMLESEDANLEYRGLLVYLLSGELPLLVPQRNGRPMVLEHVTVFAYEHYHLPMIWYFCPYGSQELAIKVFFPTMVSNERINERIESATSALEVISILDSNPITPTNKGSYDDVYEKDITLSDGRVVRALVMESSVNEQKRTLVHIYVDGVLMEFRGKSWMFTDGFWKSFSLCEYVGQ